MLRLLRELYVENLALLEKARVPFGRGFNVLTGETGAGKSLVLDALGVAVGQRATSELVRAGAAQARVEASFEVDESSPLGQQLAAMGSAPEDGLVILSREFTASGRSRSRINGRMVTTGELARLGELLVSIHTQHESQRLLLPSAQLALLDAFAGEEAVKLAAEVARTWQEMQKLSQELEALRQGERQRLHELDLLRFQIDEIAAARLSADEEPELLAEHARLSNAARLQELLGEALESLAGQGGLDGSAASMAAAAGRALSEAAALDPEAAPLAGELRTLSEQLAELARAVRRHLERCEPNPSRQAEVEARLDLIDRLKRKYGQTIEAVLAYQDEARQRLSDLVQQSARSGEVERALEELQARYQEMSHRLSAIRRDAARRLGEAVETELRDLAMPKARFEVVLEAAEPGPSGLERASFLFSANPGEPPRPLARVASGGELSRTMLACRTVLAGLDPVPVLVFDEPDAGLGGRAAQAVAERLARLGRLRQVLVVTHLPQVASMADFHLSVRKLEKDGATQVEVGALSAEERVQELARMLGGARVTESAERHATELLRLAGQAKAAT
ncbi:MAG: DNA repair protein RecN [Bacillota bacterium]